MGARLGGVSSKGEKYDQMSETSCPLCRSGDVVEFRLPVRRAAIRTRASRTGSVTNPYSEEGGGDESLFVWPQYSGGPDRLYNEFYAAMKSWGRYELVSTPGRPTWYSK